jgi:hypothetical protein
VPLRATESTRYAGFSIAALLYSHCAIFAIQYLIVSFSKVLVLSAAGIEQIIQVQVYDNKNKARGVCGVRYFPMYSIPTRRKVPPIYR